MSNSKIAVYTSIFGPYDGLLPQPKFDNIDYICFTDQSFKSSTWEVRNQDLFNNDPVRSARRIKINPHLFLQDYETSIYVDGNYLIRQNLQGLAALVFQNSPMGIYDHNQCSDPRDCAYDELEAILSLQSRRGKNKDEPEIMIEQMKRYRDEGYPEHFGLIFSAVLVRKHQDPDVIKTMETWWNEVKNYSKRDQLSFNYASWKNNFAPYYIPGDLRNNEYFYLLSKHRKDYRWKLFKFRLKKAIGLVKLA